MTEPEDTGTAEPLQNAEVPEPEELNRQDSMLLAIVIHDLDASGAPRDINWIVQRALGPGAPSIAKGLFGASLGAAVAGFVGAIVGWTALNSGHREVNRILRLIPTGVRAGLLEVSGEGHTALLSATDEGRRWSGKRYSEMEQRRGGKPPAGGRDSPPV